MTVQEMIDELKNFTPDMKVVTCHDGFRTPTKLRQLRGAIWIETKADPAYDKFQSDLWVKNNAQIEAYNEEIERVARESYDLIRAGKLPYKDD